MHTVRCRFCGTECQSFLDLGASPLANAYLQPEQTVRMEPHYPLHAYVCPRCFLVQLEEFEPAANIFSDYAYFSSFSDSWLTHCQRYAEAAVDRLGLDENRLVLEVASNDGYLLQFFKARGVPVLGVEPAANVAQTAKDKGIDTRVAFFGRATAAGLAAEGCLADLLIANNVLAHVPDLNDFVAGIALILAPRGVATLEFPHLLRLLSENQFDTIYHEHFSYFSLTTVQQVFAAAGLTVCHVERLPTHGGSLRLHVCHAGDPSRPETAAVAALLAEEQAAGLTDLATYGRFSQQVAEVKLALLEFLVAARRQGRTVAGYGAPAKGNTLLNACGVGPDLLTYTVDRSPHKQGCLLPGSRIPIHDPAYILQNRPDYLLILPWNIKDEIMEQMASIRDWGGQFVIPVPTLTVLP